MKTKPFVSFLEYHTVKCNYVVKLSSQPCHFLFSAALRPRLRHQYEVSMMATWPLTLILLTWSIWWASNNASKWQMGFKLAFKVLNVHLHKLLISVILNLPQAIPNNHASTHSCLLPPHEHYICLIRYFKNRLEMNYIIISVGEYQYCLTAWIAQLYMFKIHGAEHLYVMATSLNRKCIEWLLST